MYHLTRKLHLKLWSGQFDCFVVASKHWLFYFWALMNLLLKRLLTIKWNSSTSKRVRFGDSDFKSILHSGRKKKVWKPESDHETDSKIEIIDSEKVKEITSQSDETENGENSQQNGKIVSRSLLQVLFLAREHINLILY